MHLLQFTGEERRGGGEGGGEGGRCGGGGGGRGVEVRTGVRASEEGYDVVVLEGGPITHLSSSSLGLFTTIKHVCCGLRGSGSSGNSSSRVVSSDSPWRVGQRRGS